jgi:hypothetical protein
MRRRPVVVKLMIVLVDKNTDVNQRAAISGTKGETILVNVEINMDLPNGLGLFGITGILIEEVGDKPGHGNYSVAPRTATKAPMIADWAVGGLETCTTDDL